MYAITLETTLGLNLYYYDPEKKAFIRFSDCEKPIPCDPELLDEAREVRDTLGDLYRGRVSVKKIEGDDKKA
jgi:hypothetical protein